VRTAAALTARLKLDDHVTHRVANALDLPFDDGVFDVVWTQNSGMNISDKDRLYSGFHRVLRAGGLLVLQEPMAGPVQPLVFPVMWAREAAASFLRPPEQMRELIKAAGFQTRAWDDVTDEVARPGAAGPAHSIQRLVMGDVLDDIRHAGERNRVEGRSVMVHAVFERRSTD
jgi:SAM-dependent methyltransferase